MIVNPGVRRIQIAITLAAIALGLVHLKWPDLSVDIIILTLFIIAVVPWLAPVFKSLEFPGGWKLEFQDFAKVKKEAESAGLLSPRAARGGPPQFAFELISDEDPNLALAGLRIEIEKRLNKIASYYHYEGERRGVGNLISAFKRNDILTPQESNSLTDIIRLLNQAVHGAEVDKRAADWALEVGPKLLAVLDEKIPKENSFHG